MANSSKGQEDLFLLAKLKEGKSRLKADSHGEWLVRDHQTYLDIADGLDVEVNGLAQANVTSIPSIWARPLVIQSALHTDTHPLRSTMISRWRGMLAAIALAEIRLFPLKVQLVRLGEKSQNDPLASALRQLLPEPNYCLYTLNNQPLKDYNPWQDLYIFLWEGKSVGLSSPSTLVCPLPEAEWEGLPWYDQATERGWTSPAQHLNREENEQLWLWLNRLLGGLHEYSQHHDSETISKAGAVIKKLLEEYRDSLPISQPQIALELSKNDRYFAFDGEQQINHGALSLLNFPIKATPQPSCVELKPPTQPENQIPLIIIDPELANKWNRPPQDIWVYGDKTLATGNNLLSELEKIGVALCDVRGQVYTKPQEEEPKVKALEASNLLQEELYFLSSNNPLPGSVKFPYAEELTYEGKKITPFLPINPLLLDYFSCEELAKALKIESSGDKTKVKIILELSLSGFKKEQKPKSYTYSRTYEIKESNRIEAVPTLEIWPNFLANDWKEYYLFYYDPETNANTFRISLPQPPSKIHTFKDPEIETGLYQVTKAAEFPKFLTCWDRKENTNLGLILLKTPRKVGDRRTENLRVGVDFGTSFTNVFVSHNNNISRFNIEPLNLQVTLNNNSTRVNTLIKFFTIDIAEDLELFVSTVLTTGQRCDQTDYNSAEPYLDGTIYLTSAKIGSESYKRTGLKWSKESSHKNYTKNFLKHLALHIAAYAKVRNIAEIEWFISYPSAFSEYDLNTYTDVWTDLTQELAATTGIEQICAPKDEGINWRRSESVAIGQYFANVEQRDLIYSTCIDVGGGTSDISIWENNKLVHQCSVQFAGYHLLTQFIEKKREIIKNYFRLTDENRELLSLDAAKFPAEFDLLLRGQSEDWLKENRDKHIQKPDMQQLINYLAFAVGGLYYYTGIMLKTLKEEGKYTKEEITPIYLGGNGARLWHWLAEGGRFDQNRGINKLFSAILIKATGDAFPNAEKKVSTYLTRNNGLKDEVACGLVHPGRRLTGWTDDELLEQPLIAGEYCVIKGELVTPYQRLAKKGDITPKDLEIPEENNLSQLREYLKIFNESQKELKIPGLKPVEFTDWKHVYRTLCDELDKLKDETAQEFRLEPPFILGLKALLTTLGEKWNESN